MVGLPEQGRPTRLLEGYRLQAARPRGRVAEMETRFRRRLPQKPIAGIQSISEVWLCNGFWIGNRLLCLLRKLLQMKGPTMVTQARHRRSDRQLFVRWVVIATAVVATACGRNASVGGDQRN